MKSYDVTLTRTTTTRVIVRVEAGSKMDAAFKASEKLNYEQTTWEIIGTTPATISVDIAPPEPKPSHEPFIRTEPDPILTGTADHGDPPQSPPPPPPSADITLGTSHAADPLDIPAHLKRQHAS